MWKRGELLLRSNFSSFPHYFIFIFLISGVKLHIHLLNVVIQFIVFLTLSTLICRGTDISKCFSESLGIRDEIRLYCKFKTLQLFMSLCMCVCVHCSKVILFIIYLSLPECRDLPNSNLHGINEEMIAGEIFKLHVTTPTYATRSMSLYKTRQEKSSTGSFPASAQ